MSVARWMLPFVVGAAFAAGGCAATRESTFESAAEAQASVAGVVAQFRDEVAAADAFFDSACGYVVFPALVRGAAGIGGVYGRGVLIEQGEAVGEVRVWQLLHGITFGGELHREIIFFQDAQTLRKFREGTLEWRGRAGLAVGPWGGAATPGYVEGVAIFALSRAGLMLDASVAAARYRFRPIPGASLHAGK